MHKATIVTLEFVGAAFVLMIAVIWFLSGEVQLTPEQQANLNQILVLVLLTVIMFSFRESVKTAQGWGAFAGENISARSFLIKLLISTAFVAAIPILAVPLFWGFVETVSLRRMRSAIDAFILVALLGVFPRGTKHLWLLIARAVKFAGWANWFNWFNPKTNPQGKRPPVVYSLQVIGVCLVLPFAVLLHSVPQALDALQPSLKDLWPKLFWRYMWRPY